MISRKSCALFELEDRPTHQHCTGSSYCGTWNRLGMCGFGMYTFADGTVYEGELCDGNFHGPGTMVFPSGHIIRGIWNHGRNVTMNLIFRDGIKFKTSDWSYCTGKDRR